MTTFDIVVPTIGRPELANLLRALDAQRGPLPEQLFVVDDRRGVASPLLEDEPARFDRWVASRLVVLRQDRARGPAAARNRGWRCSRAEWVAFLDDDVVPHDDWLQRLAADLGACDIAQAVGASCGRIHVPLPTHRRPTDWERDVAGLERALWATADMAYHRRALEAVQGFDEGFPYAYREDADLGRRVRDAGYRITTGTRMIEHPVRTADRWISVRRQRGNQSDARMRRKHGRHWRTTTHAGPGRFSLHVATVLAGAVAIGALVSGLPFLAGIAAGAWLLLTVDFAIRRIAPGPRDAREVVTMLVTSIIIPPVAVFHRLRGERSERRGRGRGGPRAVDVVLVDRDGTIVVDEPYNGDPSRVVAMPGARAALDALRARGIAVGVVSNQSGVGRGDLTLAQVEAVNATVEAQLGPFAGWWYCPHIPADRCACRKPEPGLVLSALRALDAAPDRCVVIGDTAADIDAARAAGARGVLVPNPATRRDEIATAPVVAESLHDAVRLLIGVA